MSPGTSVLLKGEKPFQQTFLGVGIRLVTSTELNLFPEFA